MYTRKSISDFYENMNLLKGNCLHIFMPLHYDIQVREDKVIRLLLIKLNSYLRLSLTPIWKLKKKEQGEKT